ncbi:hypothetical protein N9937_00030 [bacterium]|nr:hypothetical protein [bacterium]
MDYYTLSTDELWDLLKATRKKSQIAAIKSATYNDSKASADCRKYKKTIEELCAILAIR